MKRLLEFLILFIIGWLFVWMLAANIGCGKKPVQPQEQIPSIHGVTVVHDDKRAATCYVFTGGISCIPDSQLQKNKEDESD